MKKVITAAGAAYILLCLMGAMMFTSCAANKSCHVKKYHVDKSVKRAQGRASAYRN